MKFILVDHISKKPITSSGHSNLELQEEDGVKRDILSKEEEIGEIDKNSSTVLLKMPSDHHI